MKVLHICTADNSGGAAKAAYRLVQGLRQAGVDSYMLVGQKTESTDGKVDTIPNTNTTLNRIFVKLISQAEKLTGLQYLLEPWGNRFLEHPFFKGADVVHFHNLHSDFFPLTLAQKVARAKPVVWTFHDLWPMTGHCTYPDMYACDKFVTGCHHCPHLEDYPEIRIDTTRLLFSLKEKQYLPGNIRKVIAPSEWMKKVALQSRIFRKHEIIRVPYGVDTHTYKPLDRAGLRTYFDIAPDEKVILFSAPDLNSERKGGALLLKALELVARDWPQEKKKIVLLGVGRRGRFSLNIPGCRFVSTGMIDNDRLIAHFLNIADLYVHPAIADNLPNAVLEALACGTPVVAFNVGGVPDMVRPGVTGYLAKEKDVADLARGIKGLLKDDQMRSDMGDTCRRVAETEYTLEIQARRMMEIYQEVL
jgi:glycosyltransferase involved in cell wall biosynthesis